MLASLSYCPPDKALKKGLYPVYLGGLHLPKSGSWGGQRVNLRAMLKQFQRCVSTFSNYLWRVFTSLFYKMSSYFPPTCHVDQTRTLTLYKYLYRTGTRNVYKEGAGKSLITTEGRVWTVLRFEGLLGFKTLSFRPSNIKPSHSQSITEWQRQRRGSNMWKFNLIQFNSKFNEINLFSFF